MKSLKTEHVHQLDVASPESIDVFSKSLAYEPVDLLFNVAGA